MSKKVQYKREYRQPDKRAQNEPFDLIGYKSGESQFIKAKLFIPNRSEYFYNMEEELKKGWLKVEKMVFKRFGEKLDEQTILFIIDLQELGKGEEDYKKHEKLDIIHIGICTVLCKYGYYKFIGNDDEGWPHFKNIKKLPNEIQGENQQNLLKRAIIEHFNLQ